MAKTSTVSFPTPTFPMVDPEALIAAHRRNLDAFTSASQILADGLKAYNQRQAEIFQAALKEWVAEAEGMFKNGAPEVKPVAEQVGQVKTAYEKAISNAEELANIAIKAQTEAMNVLGDCALANLDAFKKAAA